MQPRHRTLVVLSLALLVISLDNTILNVALPAIEDDLGASAAQLQWIVDAYLLVFSGLLLTAGALGDRFGRRRVLVGGLVLFTAASATAALADGPAALIASRAAMGVGAAAIMPSTLSILTAVFPPQERAGAIATWAGVGSLGIVLGPVLGGLLVEHASWEWVFLVNVPIGAAVAAAALRLVPESRDPVAPRLDLAGAALSVAALVTLVWGLVEAPGRGWGDATVLAAFALAAVLLTAFAVVETRVAHPMLDLAFLRNPRFSAASAAISAAFFAFFGLLFVLTQYLQGVLGHGPVQAGLWMLPLAGGLMLLAPVSARAAGAIGAKLPTAAGLTVAAGGLAWLSQAGAAAGFGDVAGPLALMGAGMGLALAPATDAIMGSLPPAKASVGSAVNDTNRIVGGTLGVAVLGSLLASGYRAGMDDATAALPAPAAGAAHDSVLGASAVAERLGGAAGRALDAAASSAFADAMQTATLAAAGVVVLGALVALAFLPARPRAAADAAPADGLAEAQPA